MCKDCDSKESAPWDGLLAWRGGRVPLVVKGNQVAGSQTSSDEQGIDNHEDDEDDDGDNR